MQVSRLLITAILAVLASAGWAMERTEERGLEPLDPGVSQPYVGFGYNRLRVTPDGSEGQPEPEAVSARIGMEDQFLGVEARGAMGMSTDTDEDVRYELDQLYGGYLRLSWPVHRRVRPYAIGGYTRVRGSVTTDLEGDRTRESLSDSGFSGGLGIDVQVAGDLALNLEVMHYVDSSDSRMTGLSLGVRSGLSPPAR